MCLVASRPWGKGIRLSQTLKPVVIMLCDVLRPLMDDVLMVLPGLRLTGTRLCQLSQGSRLWGRQSTAWCQSHQEKQQAASAGPCQVSSPSWWLLGSCWRQLVRRADQSPVTNARNLHLLLSYFSFVVFLTIMTTVVMTCIEHNSTHPCR